MRLKWLVIFMSILLLMLIPFALAEEEEEIYLSDLAIEPQVIIDNPKADGTYEKGGNLIVKAHGVNVDSLEAVLTWVDDQGQEQTLSCLVHGDTLEYTFELGNMVYPSLLTVTGSFQQKNGSVWERVAQTQVLSPKQDLINRMIALAKLNSTQSKYKFAPAESDTDIGVCKNFVMRLFDTYKSEYRMLAYPDLALHMPKNNSKAACAPYDYGIEWRPETAEEGTPFEIVYQFKYDNDLTKEQNAERAREMMHMVKKGDFFQMVGYYGGGNGPHSLFFIADYDEATDTLHWTDSNMKGKRIDGVRWGYMQFDAVQTGEWYVEVFNMKKRGATLYRLRDDLYRP